MAMKKNVLLIAILFLVTVSIALVSWRLASQRALTPNAPESAPVACDEACPNEDEPNLLQSCDPGDGGDSLDSFCNRAGRVETCGGKQYCCPVADGDWTKDMSRCITCNATAPTAPTVENISPTSVKLKWTAGTNGTQTRIWVSKHADPTSNCAGTSGNQSLCVVNDQKVAASITEFVVTGLTANTTYFWRIMNSKQAGCEMGTSVFNFTTLAATCTETTWSPNVTSVCADVAFVQTSNCGTTRNAVGTRNCGTTCTPNGTVTCNPDCSTACGQQSKSITTCTDSCGNPTSKTCAATASCCSDTTWSPDTNLTCLGTNVTQTSNCGATRTVNGTKNCCVDTTWSPSSTTNTCSDRKMTQTSNCGNTREVSGTKTCFADLSVQTKVYQDDARNKEGVYFTDKEITKASKGQILVYTIEVKNSGQGGAKNVRVTDTLTGQNQTLLTFVDSESKCKFDFPAKRLTCDIENIPYRGSENLKFRVRIAETALNGKVIRNTAKAVYSSRTKEDSVDLLVSSIVTCNEFCTSDSECSAGLACDVFSSKCRKAACSKDTSCSCISPTATVTTRPTSTLTTTITTKATATPTEAQFPELSEATVTTKQLTTTPVEITEEESLPEAGIFDLPQKAIFGGGIILAIIGLFLAL